MFYFVFDLIQLKDELLIWECCFVVVCVVVEGSCCYYIVVAGDIGIVIVCVYVVLWSWVVEVNCFVELFVLCVGQKLFFLVFDIVVVLLMLEVWVVVFRIGIDDFVIGSDLVCMVEVLLVKVLLLLVVWFVWFLNGKIVGCFGLQGSG